MTEITAAYQQNFTTEKKSTDIMEKDIRKWVESVVEFKAKLDKQKNEVPLENRLKKNKKFKTKKKPSVNTVPVGGMKRAPSSQNKTTKLKKGLKKKIKHSDEKPHKKEEEEQVVDFFSAIKESYRSLKLPPNWTSGLSNNRIVFNRVKITTQNAQQKMTVERSLVVTKDCNMHVLIKGSEITIANWEVQKVHALDDIKKAIKDIDALKLCEGPANSVKSLKCSMLIDSKLKVCEACKLDTTNPPKATKKKPRASKKASGNTEVPKQKSFQK